MKTFIIYLAHKFDLLVMERQDAKKLVRQASIHLSDAQKFDTPNEQYLCGWHDGRAHAITHILNFLKWFNREV